MGYVRTLFKEQSGTPPSPHLYTLGIEIFVSFYKNNIGYSYYDIILLNKTNLSCE